MKSQLLRVPCHRVDKMPGFDKLSLGLIPVDSVQHRLHVEEMARPDRYCLASLLTRFAVLQCQPVHYLPKLSFQCGLHTKSRA